MEESIGKTLSDMNHTSVFLGQSPMTIEITTTKKSKWDLVKLTNFCTAKEMIFLKNHKDNLRTRRKYLQMMYPTKA